MTDQDLKTPMLKFSARAMEMTGEAMMVSGEANDLIMDLSARVGLGEMDSVEALQKLEVWFRDRVSRGEVHAVVLKNLGRN